MIKVRMFVDIAGALLTRCGEVFAGYIAGTFTSAVALVFFDAIRHGLTQPALPFFALMIGIAFSVGLAVVPLPLILIVTLGEITGTGNILYYALTWGLIGFGTDLINASLPALDWFQRYSSLIFFVSGIPGGVAYWFFAGRFTRKRLKPPK